MNDATIKEAAWAAFDADHADCGREDCTPDSEALEQYARIAKAVLKVFERHHAIEQLVQMGPWDDEGGFERETMMLTDAEWREFQSIPEQGYSHRAWVDARIAERVSGLRSSEAPESSADWTCDAPEPWHTATCAVVHLVEPQGEPSDATPTDEGWSKTLADYRAAGWEGEEPGDFERMFWEAGFKQGVAALRAAGGVR